MATIKFFKVRAVVRFLNLMGLIVHIRLSFSLSALFSDIRIPGGAMAVIAPSAPPLTSALNVNLVSLNSAQQLPQKYQLID